MQYYLFVLFLLLGSCNNHNNKNVAGTSDKISIACSWVSYDRNVESFLIDQNSKTAFWANEEKNISVLEMNDAIIKLKGMKTTPLAGEKMAANIDLIFTINRITGEFKVEWLGKDSSRMKWAESCKNLRVL
jgi:hypothetical protein